MEIFPTLTLNNGVSMPTLGLGVWRMSQGEETENAVKWALEAGYRLIDTAKLYRNELSVGKAIRASGVPREEIFVTTKFWPTDFAGVEAAFERSFDELALGYIDLYLIHFPLGFLRGFWRGVRNKMWKGLERLYESKRVHAIGVSNYDIKQINELLENCTVPPTVNQVKFNPFSYDKELLRFCNSKSIVIESYSPLTRGRNLADPVITGIAQIHSKSPAQTMIRWALQHGTVVIPKSSQRDRIQENFEVFDFELTPAEMTTLDSVS
jgi:diketogulonate reductase-like aldo/keto reductase